MKPTAFQSKNGQPTNMQRTLHLPLRDLAPKNLDTSNWPDGFISIPFYQLSEILTTAIKSEEQRNGPSSDSDGDEESSDEADDNGSDNGDDEDVDE
ncbi:hypothetical protein IL306_006319 [Fusarium sp. DS 682]|nr:hypothetical protein IL306_006319 [Fusarium sp. DS 682]